jgi:acetyl esterase/lipase
MKAFDWVRNEYEGQKITLYGEGLSGGLALSVGLTEGREKVAKVVAVDPVVDWTAGVEAGWDWVKSQWVPLKAITQKTPGLANEKSSLAGAMKKETSDEDGNGDGDAALRSSYLRDKPQLWLDPFASPLFFLRTPGVELTPPVIAMNEEEREDDGIWIPPRKRRVPRRFPLNGDVELPSVLVGFKDGRRREQGMEFVKALRRTWIDNAFVGEEEEAKSVAAREVVVVEDWPGNGFSLG